MPTEKSVRRGMPRSKEAFYLKRVLSIVLAPTESPPNQSNVQSLIKFAVDGNSFDYLWRVLKDETILYSHELSAWKFCHVLNQILIHGTSNVLVSSYENRRTLKNVGTYWKRSTLDIGYLILEYCKFLVRKVKLHAKYPQIAGGCTYDIKKLEKECDLYTLCEDIFHFLDSVIVLQDAILSDVKKHKLSSTTPPGIMRVAPFVELLSDTKQLYKLSEKIMAKLHKTLPHESLCQFRKIFSNMFNGLQRFYGVVGRMAYFAQWDIASTLPTNEPVFISMDRAFIFTEDTGSFASIELRPPPYPSEESRRSPLPVGPDLMRFSKEEQKIAVIPPLGRKEEDEETKPTDGINTLILKKDKKIKELEFQNERLYSYYTKEVDRMKMALTIVQSELVKAKTELKVRHEEL